MTSSPYGVALVRGIFGAIISAGIVFCTVVATTPDTRTVVAATAGAFFAYLAQRGFVEGAIDNGSTVQKEADLTKAKPFVASPDPPVFRGD